MKISKMTALGSAALLSLGVLGGTVATADAQALTGAANQVPQTSMDPQALTEAISAAEAQTGGKAVEADWEDGQAGMVEVELMKPDGTTVTAMVNSADGSVQLMANDDTEDEDQGVETDDDDTDRNGGQNDEGQNEGTEGDDDG